MSGPEIVKAWSGLADMDPIPPRTVDSGPCKENRLFGTDIDLTRLPVPLIHEGDGGRYINTYGIMIAQTPDAPGQTGLLPGPCWMGLRVLQV